ncbi:Uncharacterized protein dnm_011890 [Desulfonema magnum]|uniref:Uncharacterized protein n=1 Tax=Desulfonema magnum TaxID=45655 RepID=A0A975GL16_9BACT|nr:Uncharacterized protein dnm_011890 [Desulfonema magnum]
MKLEIGFRVSALDGVRYASLQSYNGFYSDIIFTGSEFGDGDFACGAV